MEDPEIPDLLRKLQDAGKGQAAFDELQRYRAAALFIARMEGQEEVERLIQEARESLKDRLRQLLK